MLQIWQLEAFSICRGTLGCHGEEATLGAKSGSKLDDLSDQKVL
jgi:hypothetical protein